MTDALFDDAPYRATGATAATVDAGGRRRTQRQTLADRSAIRALVLYRGVPMHPDAALSPYDNRPGLRCATCRWFVRARLGDFCTCDEGCRLNGNVDLAAAKGARPVWPACIHHEAREDA